MSTFCAAGDRCRAWNRHLQQPGQAYTRPLCEICLNHGERAAGTLVFHYRDLEQHLPQYPHSRAFDGQPSRRNGLPIPIREDVEALQRAIWWVTTCWAEILSDHDKLTPLSKRVRDGWAVRWACTILTPRIWDLSSIGPQQLADYPITSEDDAIRYRSVALLTLTGADAVTDLIWLHGRARAWLGLTKRILEVPGRCQQRSCGRYELRQVEGTDRVYCGHCGREMTYEDYEKLGNVFHQTKEEAR